VKYALLLPAAALAVIGCSASQSPLKTPRALNAPSAHVSNDLDDDSEAAIFAALDQSFGRKGEVKDGVYRLVTPRPDLLVTVDGMDVPTGAFIESDFRFWRCPCGKALVNGQFILPDYEANDVIDELLKGGLHVAGLGPAMLEERPRLFLIRFQGEGRAKSLATALKAALSYTGEARNAPLPIDQSPPE
jgi:hypothetical protein